MIREKDLFGDEIADVKTPNGKKRGGTSRMERAIAAIAEQMQRLLDELSAVTQRLDAIEERLLTQAPAKELYTTHEVAKLLGKSPYTVREWCRYGRVNAIKASSGRGSELEWRITHEELIRIKSEGLLEKPEHY